MFGWSENMRDEKWGRKQFSTRENNISEKSHEITKTYRSRSYN